ncbi:RNA polymerase sigma factor [Aeromicrobium sp. Leaf350]|uniref:RNA polymerase sigma factor n=1 Tax=Aeromicrobium sp. Leaf350 TaxID=2876565 RepID=UPI001E5E3137|nr:sigma-70 family RNA polymerase sigma factor [Aeromicrobium sp. Leaf350]
MSAEKPSAPPVGDASDHALARRAGLGDREAFAELFARLFPGTLRYATHLLDGDARAAEDVVQEAWIKAWRALPDFAGRSTVQTWLFTIVQRGTYDRRRRRRPLAVDDDLLEPLALRASQNRPAPSSRTDPEREYLQRELWETLQLALSELPWTQRSAWMLRELEDLSYAEIAQVLDTTPTVVRGQLHRARRTLAIRMEQWR